VEIEILEERENPLFNRKEVKFLVKHSGIVKRVEVRKALASLVGWDENLVVIKKLEQQFGKTESVGRANLYKEESSLKEYEPEYVLKRNELIEGEKKEEKVEEKAEEEKSEATEAKGG